MSADSDQELDADELPSIQEMYSTIQGLQETVESQQQRINTLEDENEVLKTRFKTVVDVVDETGLSLAHDTVEPHGGVVPWLESIASGAANTDVSSGSLDARGKMLPVHKMWADVREGDSDTLDKSNRRAAVIFGCFIRRAANETPSEDTILGYNGVDASGQTYSITSTEAKRVLEETDYVEGKMYSATVKRAFEKVQRLSKRESCECSNIEKCGHGLVIFDSSGGTNRLKANKARFHDAMEAVVDAVETSADGSDDSVSPEHGQDEDLADDTDNDDEEIAEEVDEELAELTAGETDPSNTVVRRVEGEALGDTTEDGPHTTSNQT